MFAPTTQRIGIGVFFSQPSEPFLAGFLQGSAPAYDHRMIPTATTTKALFCNEGEEDVARRVAEELRVPWLYYRDAPGLRPSDVPAGARAAVYGYPDVYESPSQTAARVRADLEALTAAGIGCDLVLALYRKFGGGRYTWEEWQVLAVAEALWPLAIEFKVGAIWCFAQHRGGAPDGIDQFPAFQVALQELRAASGDWRHFPTIAAPAPQPEPGPAPTPRPVPGPAPTPVPDPVPSPEPPSPFPAIEPYEGIAMTPVRGYIVGPAGKIGRVDPSDPTKLFFDRDTPGAHEEVELTKPDEKFCLRFISANVIVNYPPYVQAFETRPTDKRGADESPKVYVTPAGIILTFVEHVFGDKTFTSQALTFVEKK